MPTTETYTVELTSNPSHLPKRFIYKAITEELMKKYPEFSTVQMDLPEMLGSGRFKLWVCYLDGEAVGFMFASFYKHIFNPWIKVLNQEVLYVEKGYKTARLLLDSFIDFGKAHADHIITCIGRQSNIKPRSIERMGFKPFETSYRIEVSNEWKRQRRKESLDL